ncbi:MAG: helix-turn-helix domain-containing protein [Planctomycetes bacterium]|nr:helix-turn-helix domain-containing protein [Planctomycetota bacterium]
MQTLIEKPASDLRLFTIDETAKILQIPPSGVRRLITLGTLAAMRLGIKLRVPARAIDRLIDEKVYTGPDQRRHPGRNGRPVGRPWPKKK